MANDRFNSGINPDDSLWKVLSDLIDQLASVGGTPDTPPESYKETKKKESDAYHSKSDTNVLELLKPLLASTGAGGMGAAVIAKLLSDPQALQALKGSPSQRPSSTPSPDGGAVLSEMAANPYFLSQLASAQTPQSVPRPSQPSGTPQSPIGMGDVQKAGSVPFGGDATIPLDAMKPAAAPYPSFDQFGMAGVKKESLDTLSPEQIQKMIQAVTSSPQSDPLASWLLSNPIDSFVQDKSVTYVEPRTGKSITYTPNAQEPATYPTADEYLASGQVGGGNMTSPFTPSNPQDPSKTIRPEYRNEDEITRDDLIFNKGYTPAEAENAIKNQNDTKSETALKIQEMRSATAKELSDKKTARDIAVLNLKATIASKAQDALFAFKQKMANFNLQGDIYKQRAEAAMMIQQEVARMMREPIRDITGAEALPKAVQAQAYKEALTAQFEDYFRNQPQAPTFDGSNLNVISFDNAANSLYGAFQRTKAPDPTKFINTPEVQNILKKYPDDARKRIMELFWQHFKK